MTEFLVFATDPGRIGQGYTTQVLFDDIDLNDVALFAERALEARRIVYNATMRSPEWSPMLTASSRRSTATTSPWRCAAKRQPRTCRTRALPASKRATLTSEVPTTCSRHAACTLPCASRITPSSYRVDNGFHHFKVALSVGVMKMVRFYMASGGSQ
jgi:pyruvate, water dikinase